MIYNDISALQLALKSCLKAGRRLSVSILQKSYGDRTFQAYVISKRPHRYSKHTAYGERLGWKEEATLGIPGEFTTRLDALRAARRIIQEVRQ